MEDAQEVVDKVVDIAAGAPDDWVNRVCPSTFPPPMPGGPCANAGAEQITASTTEYAAILSADIAVSRGGGAPQRAGKSNRQIRAALP